MKLNELFKELQNLNKALKLFNGEDEADKKLSFYVDDIHEGKYNTFKEFNNYFKREYVEEFYNELLKTEFTKEDVGVFSAKFNSHGNNHIINVYFY